ncbi:MAG TPA: hypothetical protein DHV62_03680 [Elusimicrobia bacterium]|nr:hypothetical protein [Elusimicrobiota bacterium]
MIKINLLPPEAKKKAEKKRIIAFFGLGIGLLFLIIFGIYSQKVIYYRSLEKEIRMLEIELKRLEPILKEIENKQKEKDLLTKKKQVMKDLMQNTLLYPQFLEELVNILPNNIWFSNLTTRPNPERKELEVNLDASALDNYAIADLLATLEKKDIYSNIDLGPISKTGSENQAILNFRLSFRYQPKPR